MQAQRVKGQLLEKQSSFEQEIVKHKEQIANLEKQKQYIFKDEDIQKEVHKFQTDSNAKENALKEYYEKSREKGALEQAKTQEQQLSTRMNNRKKEIEKSVSLRLEKEGIGKKMLERAPRVIRDEKEIERLCEIYARNSILGISGNGKTDWHRVIKTSGMVLFCYPRTLLGDWLNLQMDLMSLLVVSVFLMLGYFYQPALSITPVIWIVLLLVYHFVGRKKKIMPVLEPFEKAGVFKCMCMIIYPFSHIFINTFPSFFCNTYITCTNSLFYFFL